jgi:hypothetical protein
MNIYKKSLVDKYNDVESLYKLCDSLTVNIGALESLGADVKKCFDILDPILFSRLPSELGVKRQEESRSVGVEDSIDKPGLPVFDVEDFLTFFLLM